MTIHVWFDYGYYDGLLTFAQGCKTGDEPVRWCGEELPTVDASAGTASSQGQEPS